ncbi:MAG: bacteriohemerythrin [Treponema sp.]|jgi:hemerythrin|nr:bacteriohemerythrin [Treponema sp.]
METQRTDILVEWDERFSVGIDAMDNQHKKLFELTNNLYAACLKGKDAVNKYFYEVIHETVDYIRFHFTAEERILEQIQYPRLVEHRKEHEAFVQRVLNDVKEFEDGRAFVPNAFVRFLKDWILTHIAVSDREGYAKYIEELKKKGYV